MPVVTDLFSCLDVRGFIVRIHLAQQGAGIGFWWSKQNVVASLFVWDEEKFNGLESLKFTSTRPSLEETTYHHIYYLC